VNDVTDALCARTRAKEAAFDVVRSQADGLLLNAARCEGRAAELDAQRIASQAALDSARVESAGRYRLITVIVVGIVALLVGGGVGALAF
jgi:CHASE3 domain sensor protein